MYAKRIRGQMSESMLTAVFIILSGGLQDSYTYLCRGKVFANAQTGNIVLLSAHIMDGQWGMVLHYFIPLCAFAGSMAVALVILGLSRFRQVSAQGIVLAGTAISAMLSGATSARSRCTGANSGIGW